VRTYTIVVTADDDTATSTTLRLDVSGGEVRLTDVHLHAGTGLSTGQLPAIDYGLLLAAIAPATPTPITVAPAASAGKARAASTTRPARRPSAEAGDEARLAAPTPTRRPRAAGKATAAPAEAAKTGRTRRGATAANKSAAAPNKRARTAKKTVKAAPARKAGRVAGERVYRRMPEDFATVYGRAGSAAAVADHYQVPRHTAYGWIRRLSEQGAVSTGR
jgi:hypothetical protein